MRHGVWLVMFACSGSGDSEDTDPEVIDTDPPPDAPHPLCEGNYSPIFPLDMGESCAMGSNLDLCLNADSDACASAMCLWDKADPAGVRAYCTTWCLLDEPTTCPDGYACKVDECDETAVCVRVEDVQPAPGFTVEQANFFGTNNYQGYWLAFEDGVATWADSNGHVRQVDAAGVHDPGDLVSMNRAVGVAHDGVVWVWPRGGGVDVLARVADGDVTLRDLDTGVTSRGGFRAEDGTLYYAAVDVFDDTVYFRAFDANTLADVGEPLVVTGALVPTDVYPLRDHGFVALCDDGGVPVLCVGATPDDLVALPAPPGIPELTFRTVTAARRSFTPDAVWVSDDRGGIARWNGKAWIVEDLSPFQYPAGLVPLPDGHALVFADGPGGAYDALLLDEDGCWQPMHPTGVAEEVLDYDPAYDFPTGQLRDDTIGWVADKALRSIRLGDFPR